LKFYHDLAVAIKRREWSGVIGRLSDRKTIARSQLHSSLKSSFFTAMGSCREEARAGARGADPDPLSLPSIATATRL
jgi:hypothetical protein